MHWLFVLINTNKLDLRERFLISTHSSHSSRYCNKAQKTPYDCVQAAKRFAVHICASVEKGSEGQDGNDKKVMTLLMGMQQQEVEQVSCMTHCSRSYSPRSTDCKQSEQMGCCFSLDEVPTKTKKSMKLVPSK